MDKKNGMLVLTVKEETLITIGNDIKLRVYKEGSTVRVAINAPRELVIQRWNSEKKVQND